MPDVSPVGPVLTLLGTFAGIWIVVLLFRWFQRDFVDQYRRELAEERAKREAAEREADTERRARVAAEDRADTERRERMDAVARAARYRIVLRAHHIDPEEELDGRQN